MITKSMQNKIKYVRELIVVNTDKTRYRFNPDTDTLYVPITETEFSRMFQHFKSLRRIEFCIDNEITTTDRMFFKCDKLKEVIFTKKLDLRKVSNLYGVFFGCTSLEKIDLSNMLVSDILGTASYMFYGCTSLKTLDFREFLAHSKNIKNIKSLCSNCASLKEVNFGNNFHSKNVQHANELFSCCYNLESITWRDYQPFPKLVYSHNMFYNCKKLKRIDLRGMNFNTISDFHHMFSHTNPNLEVYVNDTFREGML